MTIQFCRLTSVLLLMLSTMALAEKLEDVAAKIRNASPAYVTIASVEHKDGALLVSGNTSSPKNVALFMRYLDDEIGAPELNKMTTDDGNTTFNVTVKALNSGL